MQFRNAKAAVSWAENRLNRSGVKSCLASLQKTAQTGSSDLSADELDDVAQTVTHIANNLDKPKGPAMMAIYGLNNPSRDWDLADVMTLYCRPEIVGDIQGLSPQQLKAFMMSVITDIRQMEHGKNMLAKTHYYECCNLNAHKWKIFRLYELRGMAQSMLQGWIDTAARQLEVELDAIDMLSE